MIRKLILRHSLDIGDTLMMTIAVRDLHLAYPNEYQTDTRTRWPDIWLNNPYITKIADGQGEILDIGYPLIQNSGSLSFSDAFRLDLASQLNIEIPWTSMNPDLHLTNEEKLENIVEKEFNYPGKYWVINAGYKGDAILKYYPFWREVANLLKNKIQLVQIGAGTAENDELENVYSLVGKTNVRDMFKIIYRSEGTIGPLSMQFIVGAAFGKPSVVVAGGKEPPRWQMYNNHRYLTVCGCLHCAPNNGCWTAKYQDCKNRVGGIPRCYAMIRPEDVARAVMLYYEGGLLSH